MPFKTVLSFILILLLFNSCKPSIDDLMDKAFALNKKNKKIEAIKIYSRIISMNNKIQLAYYDRGICYLDLKKYPEALLDFDTVMNLQTYGNLIFSYNKDFPGADDEMRSAVPYYDALYMRAQTEFFMDSLKSAFQDFGTCVNNNYEVSNCKLWQGTVLVKHGNKDKGCEYFQKALDASNNKYDSTEAITMLRTYCSK